MIRLQMAWFLFLMLGCAALAAPSIRPNSDCPTSCTCTDQSTRCTSLGFLRTTTPEILANIAHLDLSSANLTKLDRAIQKLRGLKSLNLAHNQLRDCSDIARLPKLVAVNLRNNRIKQLTILPKHLRHLDISKNRFAELPEALKTIINGAGVAVLKEVNLAENPLKCSCSLKRHLTELAEGGVVMIKSVTCRDGIKKNIISIANYNCTSEEGLEIENYLDKMQGDEPMEGSGSEPEEENIVDSNENDVFVSSTATPEISIEDAEKISDIESEGLLPTATASHAPYEEGDDYEDQEDVEGSGFEGETPEEGSGDVNATLPLPTDETPLKACNFDCSTPLTLEDVEATNSTEPDPSLFEELGKAFKDIFAGSEEDEDEEDELTTTETPMIAVHKEGSESGRSGDGVAVHFDEESKTHEAISDEVKEANGSFSLSNNMIIVIALIIVMICVIVYSILAKRRKNRRRPQSPPMEQEMKPLKPRAPQPPVALPEKVPLINGQKENGTNGTSPTNGTNGTSKKPVIEEPVPQERRIPPEAAPRMRNKSPRDEDALLPETHRVTVQAKELNVPKTPLLVTRMLSSDGNIITTPEPSQRL